MQRNNMYRLIGHSCLDIKDQFIRNPERETYPQLEQMGGILLQQWTQGSTHLKWIKGL
jgi:hypothetical protein